MKMINLNTVVIDIEELAEAIYLQYEIEIEYIEEGLPCIRYFPFQSIRLYPEKELETLSGSDLTFCQEWNLVMGYILDVLPKETKCLIIDKHLDMKLH